MNRSIRLLFTITFFLLVSNVYAQPSDSELLEGKETVTAVILAHGRGEGPDGKVVGLLRKAITKELGFCTLSLQMPVLTVKDFRAYAPTFPDAHKTIQAAIDYLTKEKGVKRIYLMGYSMGARMTSAFLAEKLAPLEQVQSTATSFVLKSYKVEGQLINAPDEDHRLAVTP